MSTPLEVYYDLYFQDRLVGFQVFMRGKSNWQPRVYDIALNDFNLMVQDFDLSPSPSKYGRCDLVEQGDMLVSAFPQEHGPGSEITYGEYAVNQGYPKMEKTSVDLKLQYNYYNQAIFGSRLPWDVPVYWSERMTSAAGVCRRRRSSRGAAWTFEVGLSTHYHRKFPDDIRVTLVHEMIHVLHPGDSHGSAFKAEMYRIRQQHNIPISVHCAEKALVKEAKLVYACLVCGHEYKRQRPYPHDLSRYSCRCKDRGKLYLKQDNRTANYR